jgi:hypothetical protein
MAGVSLILEVLEAVFPLVAQLLGIRVPLLALGLILVEVARVSGTPQMRHNGALHFAVVQFLPVDVLEPLVLLDALCAAGDVAQALGGVDCAEAGDEVARGGRHCRGEADAAFDDPALG